MEPRVATSMDLEPILVQAIAPSEKATVGVVELSMILIIVKEGKRCVPALDEESESSDDGGSDAGGTRERYPEPGNGGTGETMG